MKSTVAIFLFLLLVVENSSFFAQQNLVPNGSFEEYSECPEANDLNDGQFERAKGWWSPTWGTPDFFHRCNDTINSPNQGVVGVPNNFWGHQDAFHGDGYVGFVPYNFFLDIEQESEAEYIATRLVQKLKPCYNYRFQMRVNLANLSMYGYTKIGAYFTDEFIEKDPSTSSGLISRDAQVVNEYTIMDTVEWTLVTGEFQAKGNEKYLYIGYFDEPFVDDTVFLQEPNFPFEDRAGYYYVDSVSLYEIDKVEGCSYEFPNVFTPNNDGVNDIYSVDFLASEDDFEFIILNRWGNVITTLSKDNLSWDGTINNKKCTDGVYFYKYTITKEDGTKLTGNGTIHLMR